MSIQDMTTQELIDLATATLKETRLDLDQAKAAHEVTLIELASLRVDYMKLQDVVIEALEENIQIKKAIQGSN